MVVDFDQKARDWDTDPIKIERAYAVAEGIKAGVSLTSHMTAFEYGCGTGLLSFALQPYLENLTLADSSTEMLAVLKEKIASSDIRNMTVMKLDLITDSLPRERFQLIYTLMTLHHLLYTDKIFRYFYTLLDVPGYLCVADLDTEDGSFHGTDFLGHKGFERNELVKKAQEIGFQKIRFTTIFKMTRGVGESRKDYSLFLMIAEKH